MSFTRNTETEPCETHECARPSTTCITYGGGFSLHCAEHGATQADMVLALKQANARRSLNHR